MALGRYLGLGTWTLRALVMHQNPFGGMQVTGSRALSMLIQVTEAGDQKLAGGAPLADFRSRLGKGGSLHEASEGDHKLSRVIGPAMSGYEASLVP